MRIYIFLYNVFIRLYLIGIRVASIWNDKARKWLSGRNYQKRNSRLTSSAGRKVTWMHCASLGEFEQGRPVLEALKIKDPDSFYLVTFFSPSGYEVQKDYAMADLVLYLPAPTQSAASSFLDHWKPSLVLWVKYEYWYHYLTLLKASRTPLLLISAIFRERQPFFKWYGGLHRNMLSSFNHLFVQDEESAGLLHQLDPELAVTVAGDTRFDRVIQIAFQGDRISEIDQFANGSRLIVAGSTWMEDEEELHHYSNTKQGVKLVIAPHHIDEARLLEVENSFQRAVRLSKFKLIGSGKASDFNVLIIDNIGMLSRLYRHATLAYVGGGFGNDGVHNVLEAAVYGKPVVHGPVYDKYREAIELVEAGGAIPVETALEFESECNRLLDNAADYAKACEAARTYVHSNSGATLVITKFLEAQVIA